MTTLAASPTELMIDDVGWTSTPSPASTRSPPGAMPVADVRAVLAGLGWGLLLGPRAENGLSLGDYSSEPVGQ